jgi:hypothetical protein
MRVRLGVAAGIAVVAVFALAGVTAGEQAGGGSDPSQLVEQIGGRGAVNWTGGYIEAVGIGAPPQRYIGTPQARPNALRAAQVDAYRNMLEVINGVRVDSATTIRDFTVESDVINTQVQGMVRGAKVTKQEYLSDGTVEVTVRMPLGGNIAALMMSRLTEKRKDAPPPPPAASPAPASGGEVFTGLVIDARGIQARPAMSPRILDENGQEVYGTQNVEREYAVQQGMSGYARDLTAAQSNSRVTSNPLSVKGLRTAGAGRSDIVIASADADRLRGAGENLAFLKKCRVMIVLD